MKKIVTIVLALFLCGCSSQPKYVEGTSVQLGAYIPWQSNIYGVELLSYVNGCVVRTPTNMCYEIERQYSLTNDWCWGMLKSTESSNTKVKLK